VAERLETGIVGINEGLLASEADPFGGDCLIAGGRAGDMFQKEDA
jgi:succinate-semialdehyde dehydrogenase/glutarate-semialdehyde dehydrogenase